MAAQNLDILAHVDTKGAVVLESLASKYTPDGSSEHALQIISEALGAGAPIYGGTGLYVIAQDGVPRPVYAKTEAFTPGFVSLGDGGGQVGLVRTDGASGSDGNVLGAFYGTGSDGTTYRVNKAGVILEKAGAWTSSTDTPSRISLETTPDGSGTRTPQVTIEPDGGVFVDKYVQLDETTSPGASSNKARLLAIDVSGETRLVAVMPNGSELVLATQAAVLPNYSMMAPTGAIVETMSRAHAPLTNVSGALTSGTMAASAIVLYKGQQFSSASFSSGSTALSGGTNQWFAVYRYVSGPNHSLEAITASDGATAWSANSIKTLAFSTGGSVSGGVFTVPETGVYYLCVMVQATTVPTLIGFTGQANANGRQPQAAFITGGTALTNVASAPNPITSITQDAKRFWAWLS